MGDLKKKTQNSRLEGNKRVSPEQQEEAAIELLRTYLKKFYEEQAEKTKQRRRSKENPLQLIGRP